MGNGAFGIKQCRTSRGLQVKAIPSFGMAVLGWWICPIPWVCGEDVAVGLALAAERSPWPGGTQVDTAEHGCFGPHRGQEVHIWHCGHLRQEQQGQLSLSYYIGFELNLPLCVSPNTARYHGDGYMTLLRLFYLNIAKEIANAWDSSSEN